MVLKITVLLYNGALCCLVTTCKSSWTSPTSALCIFYAYLLLCIFYAFLDHWVKLMCQNRFTCSPSFVFDSDRHWLPQSRAFLRFPAESEHMAPITAYYCHCQPEKIPQKQWWYSGFPAGHSNGKAQDLQTPLEPSLLTEYEHQLAGLRLPAQRQPGPTPQTSSTSP